MLQNDLKSIYSEPFLCKALSLLEDRRKLNLRICLVVQRIQRFKGI